MRKLLLLLLTLLTAACHDTDPVQAVTGQPAVDQSHYIVLIPGESPPPGVKSCAYQTPTRVMCVR